MRRYVLALVALALVVLHVSWPAHVQVDWQTVALLSIFIALMYSRELASIFPLIKRLRIGEAEIEMRESVMKLHEEVEKAESASLGEAQPPLVREATSETRGLAPLRHPENGILALAARDKESAVVRLAIDIEKELSLCLRRVGLTDRPPRTIREHVQQLVSRKILPKQVGDAIIEFRNVRNKVIHPSSEGEVSDAVLTSAIDSGLRILRLLRSEEASLLRADDRPGS